jgi:hypothetical protein
MFERPNISDLLNTLAQQISASDRAKLEDFLRESADLIPENCTPAVRHGELILKCDDATTAKSLWREQQKLLKHATINRFTVLSETSCRSVSVEAIQRRSRNPSMNNLALNVENGCSYQNLLRKIANSEYPAFVIEVPKGWHWGQPQRCILASAQVTKFSGRRSPDWHGDDVTLLYDRPDFEWLHDRLMRELDTTAPGQVAQIKDLEYQSYTVASDRTSLFRGQKAHYNSDFEMLFIPELDMIVRVCYCKHREII